MCTNKKWIVNKYTKKRVLVDCGVCSACQQKHANARSLKIMMESKISCPSDIVTLHCTLTYDNDNIPFIFEADYDDFMNEKIISLPVYRRMEVKTYHRDSVTIYKRSKYLDYDGLINKGNKKPIFINKNYDPAYKKRKLIKFVQIDSFDGYDGRGESDWFKTNFSTYPIRYRYLYGDPLKGSQLPHIRYVVGKDTLGNPKFKYSPNRIGVIYYKDIQNWIKNLREYLKNHYLYEDFTHKVRKPYYKDILSFSFFACSELGPDSFRPHHHILLHFKKKYLEEFKQAISKTWKFDSIGDPNTEQFNKQIRLNDNASNYVSSYVNRSANFPTFFATFRPFAPKHIYSHGYGLVSSYTKLPFLLECAEKGRFLYQRIIKIDGVEQVKSFPLPSYVVNRYFPKFKGYSRINDITLFSLVARFLRLRSQGGIHFDKEILQSELTRYLDYSDNDIHQTVIAITNACYKFCLIMGYSLDVGVLVYADYYIRVWNRYYSFLNIYAYENINNFEDFIYHFDNWYDGRKIHELVYRNLPFCDSKLETDVNKYPCNVSISNELNKKFELYKKKKKVKNKCFSINSNV